MKSSRRTFLIASLGAASSVALVRQAVAAPEKVSESDPQAKSLHYTEDSLKIDPSKEPKFHKGEMCATCQFYGGGSQYGTCQVFGGKLVHHDGWCEAYVKKA